MATTSHILRFDRPLVDVICLQARSQPLSTAEIERIKEEAYERGLAAGRAFMDKQLAEFRSEVQQLQRGIFAQLETLEPKLIEQLQAGLPDLTFDLARRLLGGFKPSSEDVQAICQAALDELMPAREGLELIVSEADASVLKEVEDSWSVNWPGLKIRSDKSLHSGECMVHSRFGIVDARHQPRLDALREELSGKETR